MKRILLHILFYICTPLLLTAQEKNMIFGYTDSHLSLNLGLELEVNIQAAIEVPREVATLLKGAEITEIEIGIGNTPSKQSNYIFVCTSLENLKEGFQLPVKKLQKGWNTIILPKPHKLDGTPFFVGYKFCSKGDILSLDGQENDNHANWVRITQNEEDNSSSWNHQDGGRLNIKFKVVGKNLPVNYASLEKIVATKYATEKKSYPISIWLKNWASNVIKKIQADAFLDGKLVKTFELNNLNIPTNKLEHVELGDLKIQERGIHDLKIVLTKLNDQINNLATKNSKEIDNILTRSEYINRRVLMEHFSTMTCANCYSAHVSIDDALRYRQPIIHVIHHAGFTPDPLTTNEAEELTFFYSNGETKKVYAPGVMLDRINLSQYGATDGKTSTLGPVFFPQRNTLGKLIDERINRPAQIDLSLSSKFNSNTRELIVSVAPTVEEENLKILENKDLRINVFIVEDSIAGTQLYAPDPDNYIHNNVFRKAITPLWGDSYKLSNPLPTKEYSYIIPDDWDEAQIHIVAFITNCDNNNPNHWEVLNANEVRMNATTSTFPIIDSSLTNDTSLIRISGEKIFAESCKNSSVTIYDINGQRTLCAEDQELQEGVSLSHLKKGTYIVLWKGNNQQKAYKIILQ